MFSLLLLGKKHVGGMVVDTGKSCSIHVRYFGGLCMSMGKSGLATLQSSLSYGMAAPCRAFPRKAAAALGREQGDL